MLILKQLLRPTSISCKNISKNELQVSLEPLERGFGYTLGFALKEVMLRFLEGPAVTRIKINNEIADYNQDLPCQEDMIGVMLNIQTIAFKFDKNVLKGKLILSLSGKHRIIYASELQLSSGVKVISKNHVICHYNGKKKLVLYIDVESSLGYASYNNSYFDSASKYIGFDISFSPVLLCNYNVENARVGQKN
jgi:DNA-directed RNA polymerase subunit alpha